jgi:hypothetical protein
MGGLVGQQHPNGLAHELRTIFSCAAGIFVNGIRSGARITLLSDGGE